MVHPKCLQAQVSSLSPTLHTQALKWWRLKANGSFCCLLHESVAICQENPKQLQQCKIEPRYIDWHCKNFGPWIETLLAVIDQLLIKNLEKAAGSEQAI